MKEVNYTIKSNDKLTDNVYKMVLIGDTSDITAPGQFINIKINSLYLRRPISVFDCSPYTVSIIYKVVGKGTEIMSAMAPNEKLDCITGLGNGFSTEQSGDHPLLIGGGVGVPPLYFLAKKLIAEGKSVKVILGFNNSTEIFCKEDFESIGVDTIITTVDGSVGIKGFAAKALENTDYTYFYTCGPIPMLKSICDSTNTSGQFSFEERMGCGFGACMGCSCKTKYGSKRICKDGPVLVKEEIIW
ncbi:MAG: dihydroorotate dehydrogenase electron transfer subunit [Clostridiales bacterium]|nr:dihydroorotate dehydrogenase electron transfer subunit [Clostridiales bacterium]